MAGHAGLVSFLPGFFFIYVCFFFPSFLLFSFPLRCCFEDGWLRFFAFRSARYTILSFIHSFIHSLSFPLEDFGASEAILTSLGP